MLTPKIFDPPTILCLQNIDPSQMFWSPKILTTKVFDPSVHKTMLCVVHTVTFLWPEDLTNASGLLTMSMQWAGNDSVLLATPRAFGQRIRPSNNTSSFRERPMAFGQSLGPSDNNFGLRIMPRALGQRLGPLENDFGQTSSKPRITKGEMDWRRNKRMSKKSKNLKGIAFKV